MKKFICLIALLNLFCNVNSAIVYKNSNWSTNRFVNQINDKVDCTITNIKKRYITADSDWLYISYKNRGGVLTYERRFDNEKSETYETNQYEKDLDSVLIPIDLVLQHSKIRLNVLTILRNSFFEEIDVSTLKMALEKCISQ